jgi:hypothetical protein
MIAGYAVGAAAPAAVDIGAGLEANVAAEGSCP